MALSSYQSSCITYRLKIVRQLGKGGSSMLRIDDTSAQQCSTRKMLNLVNTCRCLSSVMLKLFNALGSFNALCLQSNNIVVSITQEKFTKLHTFLNETDCHASKELIYLVIYSGNVCGSSTCLNILIAIKILSKRIESVSFCTGHFQLDFGNTVKWPTNKYTDL